MTTELLSDQRTNEMQFVANSVECAQMITDELFAGNILEQNLARSIVQNLGSSQRPFDIEWRNRLELDQLQDSMAGEAYRVILSHRRLRGDTSG